MPVITDNNVSKYSDEIDIKIIKKSKDHIGKGLYLPGSKGRGLYIKTGDGFIDSLIGIGKTIANNLNLIKDVGTAVGSVAQASTEVANLVKKSKEAANVNLIKNDEELKSNDLKEHLSKLKEGRKKGEGFLFSK